MVHSKRTKAIAVNLIIFAVLFGLISFNKEILRPLWAENHLLSILTDVFPNFIAAFLINLAIVNAILLKKPVRVRLIVLGSSALILAIFVIEEFISLLGASTQFDINDIFASAIGVLLAYLSFELIVTKRNKR